MMAERENHKKPTVAIISGPSGVGKSTVCREVLKKINAFLSISVTSRAKSELETDGKEYWFVTKQEFQKRIDEDWFLEYAEVFGNFYGTPRRPVEEALAAGKSVILEIDVQGALLVKNHYPDAAMIFILPPNQADLAMRMTNRGRGETEAIAKKRLDGADDEIAAAWQHYNNLVINADLDQAVREVIEIIENKNCGELS
jgi:guanylate kinase